jgi:putative peptidoglycan lipid II flippase
MTALAAHQFEPRVELMLRLLRVMFPYMLFVSLAAVFMGMLNARGHFFIPAMGATMLNVVMIASVFLLAPRWGDELPQQIFALAVGVLLAGVAQAAFQLPSLRREGFRYRWVSPWREETVRQVVRRMIPGMIGVAAFQINVVVVQNLGLVIGSVDDPIIAPFNYAVRLLELPQGVFGISLATFLLPTLAGLAAEKNFAEFRANLRHAMGHLLLVNLLAAVLLIVLAEPIVRLLYERGQFGPDSTSDTAFALQCLGGSLIGYSLVNIFARAFYALGDTRTPMKISVVCLAVNLVFAVALVFPLKQGGFGLANTASSTLNFLLLLFALRKKLKTLDLAALRPSLMPMAGAAVAAGLVAWSGGHEWEQWVGHRGLLKQFGAVFVPATAAALTYAAATLFANVPSALEFREVLLQRFRRRS